MHAGKHLLASTEHLVGGIDVCLLASCDEASTVNRIQGGTRPGGRTLSYP
jgi:hypothetical protein